MQSFDLNGIIFFTVQATELVVPNLEYWSSPLDQMTVSLNSDLYYTGLQVKVMMTQGWDKAFSKRHFDLFSPPDFFTRVRLFPVVVWCSNFIVFPGVSV